MPPRLQNRGTCCEYAGCLTTPMIFTRCFRVRRNRPSSRSCASASSRMCAKPLIIYPLIENILERNSSTIQSQKRNGKSQEQKLRGIVSDHGLRDGSGQASSIQRGSEIYSKRTSSWQPRRLDQSTLRNNALRFESQGHTQIPTSSSGISQNGVTITRIINRQLRLNRIPVQRHIREGTQVQGSALRKHRENLFRCHIQGRSNRSQTPIQHLSLPMPIDLATPLMILNRRHRSFEDNVANQNGPFISWSQLG